MIDNNDPVLYFAELLKKFEKEKNAASHETCDESKPLGEEVQNE